MVSFGLRHLVGWRIDRGLAPVVSGLAPALFKFAGARLSVLERGLDVIEFLGTSIAGRSHRGRIKRSPARAWIGVSKGLRGGGRDNVMGMLAL